MIVFQSLQKFISVLGFQPPEPNQKYTFDWKSLVALIFIMKFAILTTISFLFEAKVFNDYAECFYAIITALAVLNNFLTLKLKINNFFELIHHFGVTIQNRKYQLIQMHFIFSLEISNFEEKKTNFVRIKSYFPRKFRIFWEIFVFSGKFS